MEKIESDINKLIDILPPAVKKEVLKFASLDNLIEIVFDLGRIPEVRFPDKIYPLTTCNQITQDDINYIVERVGEFGEDNRAGITRTLHRISAIRNRANRIIGLTCRVGRAVMGTIDVIADIIKSGENILLLGRPGVGKTTMLREIARVMSSEPYGKRVIIVDTSNEIAGDGDIPHPAIGRARRMQVPKPQYQHSVMIEAVENHNPQVIIIDEIGTVEEAYAARTIAERGVQLIATAHGNTLMNLIMNPTLSDLVGGVQAVILSDEEARRRGTQKTVLERKALPTFNVVIEIQEINRLAIYKDIAKVVNLLLRGLPFEPEIRLRDKELIPYESSKYNVGKEDREEFLRYLDWSFLTEKNHKELLSKIDDDAIKIFPFGININNLNMAIKILDIPAKIVQNWDEGDLIIADYKLKKQEFSFFKRISNENVKVKFINNSNVTNLVNCLQKVFSIPDIEPSKIAISEAEQSIEYVLNTGLPIELSPQSEALRRVQHNLAKFYGVNSETVGSEDKCRVRLYISK